LYFPHHYNNLAYDDLSIMEADSKANYIEFEVDFNRIPFGQTRLENYLHLNFKTLLKPYYSDPAGRGVDPNFDEDRYQQQLKDQIGRMFEAVQYNHYFQVKCENITKGETTYFSTRGDRPGIHRHTFDPGNESKFINLITPISRFQKVLSYLFVNAYELEEGSADATNFKNPGYDYHVLMPLFSIPFNTSHHNYVERISKGDRGKLTFRICAPYFTNFNNQHAGVEPQYRVNFS